MQGGVASSEASWQRRIMSRVVGSVVLLNIRLRVDFSRCVIYVAVMLIETQFVHPKRKASRPSFW